MLLKHRVYVKVDVRIVNIGFKWLELSKDKCKLLRMWKNNYRTSPASHDLC